MSDLSKWMLERNRDVAELAFGPSPSGPVSAAQRSSDERKAAGLTPFIVGTAAVAALGGSIGLDGKQRAAVGAVSVLLFLAI